jgi:hypothetical protein
MDRVREVHEVATDRQLVSSRRNEDQPEEHERPDQRCCNDRITVTMCQCGRLAVVLKAKHHHIRSYWILSAANVRTFEKKLYAVS